MSFKNSTGRLLTMIALSMLLVQCSKSNKFNYQDGTPGDGAEGPNITVDTSVKFVDVSKYAQARVFPGLVCSDESRLNNVQLNMNLNYNYVAENLKISVPPQAQFSTGLYAAPGELVIIDVPSSQFALSVQIGAWTDNLSSIQNAPRDPIIYSRQQLAPGRNFVRNLYGGHIYIYAGRPQTTPVPITFSNVVKSPDFVLGETTNEQWRAAIQTSCVPWLELRSKHMTFVVPREYCLQRPINDPTAAMQEWDNIIEMDYYDWLGLEENPVDSVDKAPLLPWRVVQDIKPVVGYGHSGFPIVVTNDFSWFSGIGNVTLIDGGGNWGIFHELGHNNQQTRYWSWGNLGEVSCNFFAFKVAKRLEAQAPAAWPPKHPALAGAIPRAIAFAQDPSTTKNFDGQDTRINDPFSRLTPFIQMLEKVPAGSNYNGWEIMTALYKRARRSERISLNDQAKRDFVYETVCEFTGLNWIPFFRKWGIVISNISQNKFANLPTLAQDITTYNPLTRTGGNDGFFYNRATWTVTPSSEETSGEGAAPQGRAVALLDGSVSTFWHSRWSSNAAVPPHTLTFDMGGVAPIRGFKITQRQNGSRNIRNITIETSTNGTTWTAVTGSPFSLERINGEQLINLPANLNIRYFRLRTLSNADVYDGSQFACLSEVDIIKP